MLRSQSAEITENTSGRMTLHRFVQNELKKQSAEKVI